jgi:ubiquitin carboxyl-terminal hydrolase 1
MNSHPVTWESPSKSLPKQEQTIQYSGLQKAVTTLALLLLGYYALHFLDVWPSSISRFLYDFTIYLIPSRAIYALQHLMARYGRFPDDAMQFRKADFGNQYAKAEAIRRMLGHSPFPTALRKARSLSGIESIIPQNKEPGPPGLGNWDNSCYQNSVLQGLASLPAFLCYIEKSLYLCDHLEVSASTHRALRLFLAQLSDTSRAQSTIWTPTVLKSMDSWQQQDAQEYFSRIVEAVDKEAIRCCLSLKRRLATGLESLVKRSDADDEPAGLLRRFSLEDTDEAEDSNSPVQRPRLSPNKMRSLDSTVNRGLLASIPKNPMDGRQSQALECQTCGFSEGATLTPFSCLTLNMGLRGPSYLEELLDEYTDPEIVEGVECTECTKARADGKDDDVGAASHVIDQDQPSPSKRPKLKPVLRNKAKQITISTLPKDLVLHINRSIFDDWGNQRKNAAPIEFPVRLEVLSSWCFPFAADEDRTEAVYELRCVVMHHGRHENGHYVAFAKRDKYWFCFNDEIVTPVNEADVLSRGNVFMLFYEAIDDMPTNLQDPEPAPVDEVKEEIEPEQASRQQQSSSSSGSESEAAPEPESVTPVQPVPQLRTASGSIRLVEANSVLHPPAVLPV